MKPSSMENPAAGPMLLLCIAIGVLLFMCNVWPGLPSSTIETNTKGTLSLPGDSSVPAGTSAMR